MICERELVSKAESLLVKIMSCYEYEETVITYKRTIGEDGEETLTPLVYLKRKKFRAPSVSAIILVLTKFAPQLYGKQDDLYHICFDNENADKSLIEIEAEIKKLESELAKL